MAKRNDPKGMRMQAIQSMHKKIQGAGDLSLKRFLAACSYDMGLTRKTAMSYLQDLVDLDFIEVNENIDLLREVKPE